MEVIEMPWEENNLGVSSVEFRFDGTEKIEQIGAEIYDNNMYEYQICRVPSNCMEIAYFLQEKGFRYAETAFELSANLKEDELPNIYKKYLNMLSYHEADERELLRVEETIHEGIFNTDRIALDSFFSDEKSGKRFGNWYRQELASGNSKCYIVETSTSPLGFFVLKEKSETISDSLLVGLFDSKKRGFGFPVIYYPFVQARKEGKKKIIARVSSNNIVSLKMNLAVGYKLDKINYLFVKHLTK